jgi:hypothetical protein
MVLPPSKDRPALAPCGSSQAPVATPMCKHPARCPATCPVSGNLPGSGQPHNSMPRGHGRMASEVPLQVPSGRDPARPLAHSLQCRSAWPARLVAQADRHFRLPARLQSERRDGLLAPAPHGPGWAHAVACAHTSSQNKTRAPARPCSSPSFLVSCRVGLAVQYCRATFAVDRPGPYGGPGPPLPRPTRPCSSP